MIEIDIQDAMAIRQVEAYLKRTSLEIAAGKRGLVGAGELAAQAAELSDVLNSIKKSLDNQG